MVSKLESDGWDYGSRPEIYRQYWDKDHPNNLPANALSRRKAIKKLYRQYKKEQRQSTDGEAVASAIISSVIIRGV